MKNLYLIRHAKSDWSDESQSDFERGLNKRGQKAIPTMAKALKEKKVMPDLILSSSAKRAQLTAKGLAKEIGYTGNIKYSDALYMAEPLDVISMIKEIKDKYDDVFIIGHNPETTELTDLMLDDYIDNVPTLGIVALKFPIKHWKKLKPEKVKLNFFIYPKMYT
ncbi:histidine phosphatase family protein [Sulfurovum sp. XGS-02]|uniref:SixA phosphatase family protein n=1 Tax=Sulfurovum sp. XGS-02 TaxID=2925411 RepID=UPI00206BA9BE|nr:histidine phosphatase family protein [Sulfurovum sp. XGS-02]UPT77120.1 histidine phosphatase family protein [Sulfurovum sp. XGS-02]